MYKSLDTGKTWARIDGTGTNVLPANAGRIALSIASSNPSTLYAGLQDPSSGNLLGFFKEHKQRLQSDVIVVCARGMFGPVTLTLTPGRTAPEESFTMPRRSPVVRCA